jgi:hypothetical protein
MEQGKSRLQFVVQANYWGKPFEGEARLATSPGSRLGLLLKMALRKKKTRKRKGKRKEKENTDPAPCSFKTDIPPKIEKGLAHRYLS